MTGVGIYLSKNVANCINATELEQVLFKTCWGKIIYHF